MVDADQLERNLHLLERPQYAEVSRVAVRDPVDARESVELHHGTDLASITRAPQARTMRMALVAVAMGCGTAMGCWAAPHGPSAPAARVRLAHDGEFPAPPRDGLPFDDCALRGPVDRALYAPLLAYARTQLLVPDTKAGLPADGLDVRWEGEPVQTHRKGVFDRIVIAPRAAIGQLTIGQNEWSDGRSSWGMSTDYCVHVIDEHGERVLVLVPGYSAIGSATPTRSSRAAST
jgi:hypothetical protein